MSINLDAALATIDAALIDNTPALATILAGIRYPAPCDPDNPDFDAHVAGFDHRDQAPIIAACGPGCTVHIWSVPAE